MKLDKHMNMEKKAAQSPKLKSTRRLIGKGCRFVFPRKPLALLLMQIMLLSVVAPGLAFAETNNVLTSGAAINSAINPLTSIISASSSALKNLGDFFTGFAIINPATKGGKPATRKALPVISPTPPEKLMPGTLLSPPEGLNDPQGTSAYQPDPSVTPTPEPSPTPTPSIYTNASWNSLFSAENNLGSPTGQGDSGYSSRGVAGKIREKVGNGNFSFDVPIVSIPGRGNDASVSMTYNSQLWTKFSSGATGFYSYNIDRNWVAPGFNLSFGYIDAFGGHYSVTSPNGTRHELIYKEVTSDGQWHKFESVDGDFLQISTPIGAALGGENNMWVQYPDGTSIAYGTPDERGRRYPAELIDRNGNTVSVSYLAGDHRGRINKIVDTMNREIIFHYDGAATVAEKSLLAVSVPGIAGGARREVVRFYYANIAFQPQNRFDGVISVFNQTPVPATMKVLQYVYFPGTKNGFKYDYSTHFGMIYKITHLAGMEADAAGVTGEGQWVNWTKYNYPGIDSPTPTLTDIPKYNKRTDEWQGRNSASPLVQTYQTNDNVTAHERVSRVFLPDGNISQTKSYYKPAEVVNGVWTDYWDNGLMFEASLLDANENVLRKQILTWIPGPEISGIPNSRLEKVESINEAGESTLTKYLYDNFNNPIEVTEYGFPDASGNRPELRKTVTTYETGIGWMAARLIRLPIEIKQIINNVTVSKIKYEYDDKVNILANPYNPPPNVTERANVAQHRWEYNPFVNHNITICGPEGCVTVLVYYAQKLFKGNVTKITRYADASASSDPKALETTYKYDMLGNVLEAGGLGCCNEKTWEYTAAYQFAFPISQTKEGNDPITGTNISMVNKATYDYNTGLVTETEDENGQETKYQFENDTLRPRKTIYPSGGYTETEYSDKLISDTTQLVPGFIRRKTTMEANKIAQSYTYFNGRGAGIRTAAQTPDGWNISATEYDFLGRPQKSYNPFYGAEANSAIPSGLKYMSVAARDALGRSTEIKQQDGTSVKSTFNGAMIMVEDQAGNKKRQISDALGRIVRVDEPDLSGDLGTIASPKQPTVYEYDGNDNLAKVTQSTTDAQGQPVTQIRKFRFDSLSRLTHEKQVEATPTLDDAGNPGERDDLNKWTKVLEYDNLGLLRKGVDARGVVTNLTHYDGMRRIRQVSYSDGTPTVTYTYDQARNAGVGNPYLNKGRLTRIETADGGTNRPETPATATEFDYDKMGQAVAQRQSIGNQTYNLSYGYNLGGQLISQTYPSGKVVTTGFDTGGRMTSIADAGRAYASGFQYLGKAGALSGYALGNGTTETFALNDRLQMESQSLKKGAEVIQRYDYSFGQINAETGTIAANSNNGQLAKIDSYIGSSKQWEQRFAYDSVSRLSETREYKQGDNGQLSYKQKFDYDRFGNLYRKSNSNPETGQQTPLGYIPVEEADINKAANQFTANTVYDKAGNIIQDSKFRNLKYYYDADGRMYKTSNLDGGSQANSVYDASGQRIATRVSGVWTYKIYDLGGKLVAEYGQSSGGSGVKYTFQDWQGSTRAITNQNGVIQTRLDYQAFGQEIGAGVGQRTIAQGYNADSNLNQKYALTETDEATGLDHTVWRKLEPNAGRWTSPDPYNGSSSTSNPQSFNKYVYVDNQPTNFVDPSGLNKGDDCTITLDDGTQVKGKKDAAGVCQYDLGDAGSVNVDWGETFFISSWHYFQTGNSYGNWYTLEPLSGGFTNNDVNALKEQNKINHALRERAKQKQKDFDECLATKMRGPKLASAAIVTAGTITMGKDSLSGLVDPISQGKRAFTLFGTLKALQLYEPSFNEARDAAITECRSSTGYTGPIVDGRHWIFKPASSLINGN
jgi:RHS repeat-associated protein